MDGEGGFVWFEKEEGAWLVSCSLLERPERPGKAELCGLENRRPWVFGKIRG